MRPKGRNTDSDNEKEVEIVIARGTSHFGSMFGEQLFA